MSDIDECNKLLVARTYVNRKQELEENVDLLKEVKNSRNKEKYKIELQKLFLDCLDEKIRKLKKEEQERGLIQTFKILRYYNFIVYDDNRFIKDIEAISEQLEEIENKVIIRLYELKVLNHITKDIKTDIKIIRPIFNSRIMNLNNVYIQPVKKDKRIEVNIFDGDVQEFGFEIEDISDIKIKNKKIKLFD